MVVVGGSGGCGGGSGGSGDVECNGYDGNDCVV